VLYFLEQKTTALIPVDACLRGKRWTVAPGAGAPGIFLVEKNYL